MTQLETLIRKRWRIASLLTLAMVIVYFGFIFLVGFHKELMGMQITEGLSLGILLGVVVILAAWVFTLIFVYWANKHLDVNIRQLQKSKDNV